MLRLPLPDNTVNRKPSNFHRRGLTFVELTIGMAITAVLMLALATFASAVSVGWKHSEAQFKVRSVAHQSSARLDDALSDMLCVVQALPGDTSGGNAYLFCWHTDTWAGAGDRKAQYGELSLIEYDPATKTIWLYETKDAASLTAAQQTTAAGTNWPTFTASTLVSSWKSSGIVKPRVPLVGGASAQGGTEVTKAQFGYYSAANGKPIASYQLVFGVDGAVGASNDNVPLRAAQTPTN